MSIQEHLNKIRNAIYGREVRESIAKGIETAYDDASEKDNANMEVKIARGTHPNLRSRLEEVDNKQQQTTTQLAQKATKGEIGLSDLDKNKTEFDGTWFSDDFLNDLSNNEINTTYLEDSSITTPKYVDESVVMSKLSKGFSGLNNYTTDLVFQDGRLVKIEEKDGIVVKQRTTLTYDNDTLKSVYEQLEDGDIRTELLYSNDNVSSLTKQSWKKRTFKLEPDGFFELVTHHENSDYVTYTLPDDLLKGSPQLMEGYARVINKNGTERHETTSHTASESAIGGFYWGTNLRLVFEKGKYATLEQAKADLAGITVISRVEE